MLCILYRRATSASQWSLLAIELLALAALLSLARLLLDRLLVLDSGSRRALDRLRGSSVLLLGIRLELDALGAIIGLQRLITVRVGLRRLALLLLLSLLALALCLLLCGLALMLALLLLLKLFLGAVELG